MKGVSVIAFYGDKFIFNGIPSEEYGLIIYDIGDKKNSDDNKLGTDIKIIEDRISRKLKPLHYGVTMDSPLTFPITFGSFEYLDRYDIDVIGRWLTGHSQYKYLDIIQDDMVYRRYKCLMNNFKVVTITGMPVAFTCDVTCDSPFAYSYPTECVYNVTTTNQFNCLNQSSYNGNYYPNMNIQVRGGDSISIINQSDNNREFKIEALSSYSGLVLNIDGDAQIIKSSNDLYKPYQHFNYNFFRLVQGNNRLTITGNCIITVQNEFPIAIGG